ncbi:GAL4 [Aspergillus sclerotialis]|uniref:GAL4 n=1 Tax=Aspergillus sclerotialis TaxID=2070753 RepID=A0A3A3A796_9EURO|nr:GAL4 [Aspergillus sclerotialis]
MDFCSTNEYSSDLGELFGQQNPRGMLSSDQLAISELTDHDGLSSSDIGLISSYLTPSIGSDVTDWSRPGGRAPQMLAADPTPGSTSNSTDAWSLGSDRNDFQISDSNMLDPGLSMAYHRPIQSAKRPRSQNHSCDPCRAAKRACDLPPRIAIQGNKPQMTECTMCKLRGAECTVTWLASRQTSSPTKKRATINPTTQRRKSGKSKSNKTPSADSSPSVGISEHGLARRAVLRETCSQRLCLYIDVVDAPLVDCLSPGCMPPCYSRGIKALDSTPLEPLLEHVLLDITDCWEVDVSSWARRSAAPQLVLAVSLLDAILQRSGFFPNCSARDKAITETWKWVAMAVATQFTPQDQHGGGTSPADSETRDIAFAAWKKARQMIFENIAATTSFRFALLLVLFGAVLPPRTSTQASLFEEDAAYAQKEGIQRLQVLCARVQSYLFNPCNDPSDLPSPRGPPTKGREARVVNTLSFDVRDQILEVIGGLEWLVAITHSAVAVNSNSRVDVPAMPNLVGFDKRPSSSSHRNPNSSASAVVQPEEEVERSIIARAMSQSRNVTALWDHGISKDTMTRAVGHTSSIAVLLWRALALFTGEIKTLEEGEENYEEIQQHYTMITTLIGIWRSVFGQVDRKAVEGLQRSHPDILRNIYFASTDVDLAVLLFFDSIQPLEANLEAQTSQSPAGERLRRTLREMNAYHRYQRLRSAMNISDMAVARKGMSSHGIQSKTGLKANIQDIGAHPKPKTHEIAQYPALVIQAHQLAAKSLADEIQDSIHKMDTGRVSELNISLGNCMQGLQRLQKTFVMFPDITNQDNGNNL